jgi:hypothetical protein
MRTIQSLGYFSMCSLGVLSLSLTFTAPVFAAPPDKPPCGTNGPVEVTSISPSQYSYTRGESGHESFSFTVSSPGVQVTGNCDSGLPRVFGNGSGANPTVLPLTISISTIEQGGVSVDSQPTRHCERHCRRLRPHRFSSPRWEAAAAR